MLHAPQAMHAFGAPGQGTPGSPGAAYAAMSPHFSDTGGSAASTGPAGRALTPNSTGRGGSGFGGVLNSLRRALPSGSGGGGLSPRPHSPASSFAGSELGTPPSRSKLGLPSFTNGQRKREVIRKLEDDLSALQMQLQTRSSQLSQLQHQASAEQAARVEAQERLNMQYFKSHLLVEMLVAQLLLPDGAAGPAPAAAAPAAPTAAAAAPEVQPQQQAAAVLAGGGPGGMMAQDSFDA